MQDPTPEIEIAIPSPSKPAHDAPKIPARGKVVYRDSSEFDMISGNIKDDLYRKAMKHYSKMDKDNVGDFNQFNYLIRDDFELTLILKYRTGKSLLVNNYDTSNYKSNIKDITQLKKKFSKI
jgi:hypothetical protein